MKMRIVVFAAGAVVLLGLPVLVAAQQKPISVKAGDRKAPKFVGASGKAIPAGAIEVVQVGPGAAYAKGKESNNPLDKALGRIIEDVDGAVFQGPCELACKGGVSYYVPEGSSALCTARPDGTVSFTPVKGEVYARNKDLTLTVGVGGSISSDGFGRFIDVTGTGAAERDGEWVSFTGAGGMQDLQDAFAGMVSFQGVKGTAGPSSSSKALR